MTAALADEHDVDEGPIDSRPWPRQLKAHAVSTEDERRLFGYDVETDLAAHYRFSDLLFLSLAGELPGERESRAFELAMMFGATMSVAEAPVHAAVLARLCGVRPGGVMATATLTLGDYVSALLAERDALDVDQDLPPELRARDEVETRSVARLERMLRDVIDVPLLRSSPRLDLAILEVFRTCGLSDPFALAAAFTMTKMPSALAEASQTAPGDFPNYPIDTPHVEYVGDAHDVRHEAGEGRGGA